MKNNLSLTYRNDFGDTALHAAAKGADILTMNYLCEKGLDTNIENKFLQTPLFFAAESGNLEVVTILQRYGCKFHIQDKFGDTVLHYAAKEGCTDIVEHIIKKCPALLNIINQEGKNAHAYALDNNQVSSASMFK